MRLDIQDDRNRPVAAVDADAAVGGDVPLRALRVVEHESLRADVRVRVLNTAP